MTTKITNEEFSVLVHEVAERFKDTIFIDDVRIARGLLEQIRDDIMDYPGEKEINFSVVLQMTALDMRQIIGRQRRGIDEDGN